MRRLSRYILTLGLALLPASATPQGIGIGAGLDDLRQFGAGSPITPCATNLVFNQTVKCNAVAFLLLGK